MKKMPKSNLGDKLHRGFVWTCIGLTGLGFLNLVVKGVEYMVVVRPERKLQQAKYEQELLKEGTGLSGTSGETLPA